LADIAGVSESLLKSATVIWNYAPDRQPENERQFNR
jgi:hypothetical protein